MQHSLLWRNVVKRKLFILLFPILLYSYSTFYKFLGSGGLLDFEIIIIIISCNDVWIVNVLAFNNNVLYSFSYSSVVNDYY